MTRIILLRHCETKDNAAGKLQGYHNDSPFTPEGERQLQHLVARLREEDIADVYCSDLGRAITTAEAIAKTREKATIALRSLRECDPGDWGLLPVKEMLDRWTRYYEQEKAAGIPRENIRPPNGENSFDHQKRVMQAVQEIVQHHLNETIVIVGHGGTNKVIIGTFLGKDPDDFYTIKQANACINIIETNGVEHTVVCVNEVSHLGTGAPQKP